MITQTIKLWFYKMFSWWPWKRSTKARYARSIGSLGSAPAQEHVWRTTVDGQGSQSGSMSVAIEQGDISPISGDSVHEILSDPSRVDVRSTIPHASSLTSEQRLTFLKYLVERGQVNEGFVEGNVPRQYKKK